jgi:hypothetical protein
MDGIEPSSLHSVSPQEVDFVPFHHNELAFFYSILLITDF